MTELEKGGSLMEWIRITPEPLAVNMQNLVFGTKNIQIYKGLELFYKWYWSNTFLQSSRIFPYLNTKIP